MCYLKIQTNLPVSRAAEATVVNEATALLASELVCSPTEVAIAVEADARLFLAGTDDPAAFLDLKLRFLPAHAGFLAEALTEVIHLHLGIPEPRICVQCTIAANGVAVPLELND